METNKLASCLATISESKELAKDAAREKKAADAEAKKSKKEHDKFEFENKKAEVYDELAEEVSRGLAHVCGLPNKTLQQHLKYYFGDTTPKHYKMNRDQLVTLAQNLLKSKETERNAGKEDL